MLTTHIIFNGQAREAIELYKKALGAEVKTVIDDPENNKYVIHSEITIHEQLLMLNDFGDNDGFTKSGGYQLAVRFDSEKELKDAYSYFEGDCMVVSPMQAFDYTPCQIRFIDKFGVRWGFYV